MQLVFSQQDFERFDTEGEPPQGLCCDITRRLVVRPVSNPQWPQHVFEHKALHRWLGAHKSHPTDPMSRTPLAPEQVRYDARRGMAAKLFRRQLAAHHKQRATAPHMTAQAADEARTLAAAYTVQRFVLERTAQRASETVSEFHRLLSKIKGVIQEVRIVMETTRSSLIERLLDPQMTSAEFAELSGVMKTTMRCYEAMVQSRDAMLALPTAERATFSARRYAEMHGEHLRELADETTTSDSQSHASSGQSTWWINQDQNALVPHVAISTLRSLHDALSGDASQSDDESIIGLAGLAGAH